MINFSGASNFIFRNNTWLDPTKDWTIAFYAKQGNVAIGGGQFRTYYQYGDRFSIHPYIYFGSTTGGSNLSFELFDGTTFLDSAAVNLTNGQKKYAALVYTASNHTVSMYYDGALISSIVSDLSLYPFVEKVDTCGGSPFNDHSIAYMLQAQRAYTIAQLNAQAASITVVDRTSLLSYCPLQAGIDITDHNNILPFFCTSTVTTDTDDPLLSIVAGPPTNITPATAKVITADSAYFQDVVSAGAATTVYFSYTPASAVKVFSVIGMPFPGEAYSPRCWIALNLANANGGTYETESLFSRGMQFPNTQTQPNTYIIKVQQFAGSNPAHLQFSILENLNLPVPVNSYAINDDGNEAVIVYPLALLDVTTGYPINFINGFKQGEGGEIINNSRILLSNGSLSFIPPGDNKVYLMDMSLVNTLASQDMTPTVNGEAPKCIASNRSDKFLVGQIWDFTHNRLWIVDNNCAIINHFDIIAADFICAIGVLPDFSIAYVCNSDANNQPIKRVDLTTGAYLTDLFAGLANYGCGRDILCYDTNTILIPLMKGSATTSIIVRKYKSDGTLVETHNFDAYAGNGTNIADVRLCAYPDTNYYIIWTKGVNGYSNILKVAVNGGAVISATPQIAQYEGGQFIGPITSTPQRFGHSESCPIWVTRAALFSSIVSKSGLYKMTGTNVNNPRISHDNDWIDASAGTSTSVPIPNPFGELYLTGDE